MLISMMQIILVSLLMLFLGFCAGKAYKKKNIKIFYSILVVGLLSFFIHVYTFVKPMMDEYKTMRIQQDQRIEKLYEKYNCNLEKDKK